MAGVAKRRSRAVVEVAAAGARSGGAVRAGGKDADTGFEPEASAVLGELRSAVAELLASAPAPTGSCAEVESALGIDAMLAWQVLRIARVTDPFAAGIKVPARVSMGKLMKAAARRRVPEGVLGRVSRAYEGYERLVAEHAGSRAEFELMVSAYSPEAREKAELTAKESVFKGMSQLKGVMAEADFTSMFWYPSTEPTKADTALVEGHVGIRRVRPGSPILFSDATFGTQSTLTTLTGAAVESGRDALIPEFSTSPLPAFNQHRAGNVVYHSVSGEEVGLRSTIDLVRGTVRHGSKSRYRQRPGHYAGMIEILELPTKRLTVDCFVHEEVFPGVWPELAVYDTATNGVVTQFNDPSREHDRVHLLDVVRPLGTGFGQAKLTHVPRYVEMLEYLCDRLSLRPAQFRGFRLDVQFPIYGTEYMIGFRLPDPPAGG